ncbi:MAG: hypothetical protein HUK15_05030, partial [Bacteroidales bacterium]|nr:hypothetical protein [Bacteroidales bacterium]
MKKFILNIFVVLFVAASVLLGFTWRIATSLKRADFKLADTVHIVAIGPSTTSCALNEKWIHGFKNLSKNGTPIPELIPSLPSILDENPSIDTVLINHGRFIQDVRVCPKKESVQFIRFTTPVIFFDVKQTDWVSYALNPNFYGALLNPIFFSTIASKQDHLIDFGFQYDSIARNDLHNNEADWSVAWYDKQTAAHGSNVYTKEFIMDSCSCVDYWSRRAIEICRERNVVPVL